ncbi:MAG: GntR family transcriptional regulator [Rhodospirillales bacterium]
MAIARLKVQPIEVDFRLTSQTYKALKQAITSMNIYAGEEEIRLDERQLSQDLGVSRTPIREAMARLAQEGLLRIVARKGAFVVRKTKAEIIEMITVWAALESMAARLITLRAGDAEIATLRKMFASFEGKEIKANIDEYSDTNVQFHQTLLRLSQCDLLNELTENLFIHINSIRASTIGHEDRFNRSIIDHMHIIEALERRDTELAERLVRDHTLNLAAHVDTNVDYLI